MKNLNLGRTVYYYSIIILGLALNRHPFPDKLMANRRHITGEEFQPNVSERKKERGIRTDRQTEETDKETKTERPSNERSIPLVCDYSLGKRIQVDLHAGKGSL